MRVLGLDASTNTIGISIIDYIDGNFTLIDKLFYKPPKKGHPIEKLAFTKMSISNVIEKYKPDHIALEDIILFMKGKSTAKTTTSLAALNRTVGLAAYEYSNVPPTLLNVLTIRHAIKDKTLPSKEDIPELVAQKLGFKWEWMKDKNGKIMPENYDVADGIAVALAFICLTLKGGGVIPQKSKKPKKSKKTNKK
ncbi:MAG: hypothetical protein RLY43_2556 [Bacteroidota bacterium]|jgi:crossover junction endodeoxyribonuclease RuvC